MRAVSLALAAIFCSQMVALGANVAPEESLPLVTVDAPVVTAPAATTPVAPAPVAPVVAPAPVAPAPQPKIWCSSQEVAMMEFVIEREAHGGSLAHKKIIANIIINRVISERFPNSVSGVLHAKNQFTTISNYYTAKVRPNADTINAVYQALYDTSDYSHGALFFYAPKYASKKNANWFENKLTFVFAKEGHRFFK